MDGRLKPDIIWDANGHPWAVASNAHELAEITRGSRQFKAYPSNARYMCMRCYQCAGSVDGVASFYPCVTTWQKPDSGYWPDPDARAKVKAWGEISPSVSKWWNDKIATEIEPSIAARQAEWAAARYEEECRKRGPEYHI